MTRKIKDGVLCVFCAICANAKEIDLQGIWRLEQSDDPGVTCPVRIPGGNYAALIDAGIIPDPYRARNEHLVQWPRTKDWIFTRTFEVPEDFARRREIVLRLEGVDLFATVRLNGVEVGRTRDRFLRYDFDVTSALKSGCNELEVRFASTEKAAVDEAGRYPRFYQQGATLKVNHMNYLRTVLCKSGWDWGITLMDTGIMDKVVLIVADCPRINYVYTRQTFGKGLRHCTLDVFAELSDGTTVTNRLEIDDPPLWWPNGLGEQKFYEYEIDEDGVVGRAAPRAPQKRRIGLRKLEVDRRDGALGFVVNDVPVFAKGANWIPVDAIETRQTQERYRWLLESAANANMNMIRVWGGGKFEKDAFYDLCDELGLLVWQDFPFAGAVFPSEEIFYEQIRPEIRHQLKRLRDHASIALWSGDNECVNACRDFSDELKESTPGEFLANAIRRERELGALVAANDPTRLFWPSSPSPGPGATARGEFQNEDSGDMHVWSVWFGRVTGDHYHTVRPRFCSEFGYQSFMSEEEAGRWLDPKDVNVHAPAFRFHEKCARGNERMFEMLDRMFAFRKDGRNEIYLSQVLQAMFVRTGIEAWRSRSPRCRGSLFWQLNDNWPVSSWSSIEYSGKWKQLQFHAKRAYAPVVVMSVPKAGGAGYDFVVANDGRAPLDGQLKLRLFDFSGREISSESVAFSAAPNVSTAVASRSRAAFGEETDLPGRFVRLELVSGERRLATNCLFFAPFKDCRLEKPTLKVEFVPDDTAVVLSTDVPAFFVWAEVPGAVGEFDDNSIMLLPNESRRLNFRAAKELDFAAFRRVLKMRNLMSVGM